MNLQQLRILREAVDRGFNLTEVGEALNTSQSGVSRHIKDLEEELGIQIFLRRGKRLIGLTDPGKEVVRFVQRILRDVKSIKRVAQAFSHQDSGTLTLATTHTQARYALPPVISEFKKAFPAVQLVLQQGSPSEIATLLLAGEADIGIATETLPDTAELVTFPYYEWRHALVVPAGHPLAERPAPSLQEIAAFPIVTYTEGYTGRGRIDRAFAQAGLAPHVAMSALDADVIKAYVELGLGIGIVASMSHEPDRDRGLRLIPVPDLFEANVTYLALRRGAYLRGFACRFISLCVPSLSERAIRAAVTEEEASCAAQPQPPPSPKLQPPSKPAVPAAVGPPGLSN